MLCVEEQQTSTIMNKHQVWHRYGTCREKLEFSTDLPCRISAYSCVAKLLVSSNTAEGSFGTCGKRNVLTCIDTVVRSFYVIVRHRHGVYAEICS